MRNDTRIFVLIVLALTGAVWAAWAWAVCVDSAREQAWVRFRTANHCVETSKISGEVIPTFGVGANGQAAVGFTQTSDRIGWTCSDGKTYYR